MTIVAFNFTKVSAEKKPMKGGLRVTNNITLKKVEEAKLSLGDSEQSSLNFWFSFTSSYKNESDDEVGKIALEGFVVDMLKKEEADKIIKQWKKEKKLDTTLLEKILNYALDKCNIQAILMSKEIGLPAPLKLPRIAAKK